MWNYHNRKMIELKKIYQKISQQTQNRLQEIFNSFNIDFEHFYNIADIKTKNRINTYIEEWKDKGLLNSYFGILANNIYKRTRVKNSEILELLIYGAYIEEQSKLDEYEKQIMYEDANYYYVEGQKEVNKALDKKKSISMLDKALFLYLLAQPNVKGYVWNDYIEAITKYNAEQIFRQVTIDLQQQKELDITNDIYQNLIKRQSNSKLNINNDKISGEIDLTLIGINNRAKIEGIYSLDKKAKCRFIAVIDEHSTKMCQSLNNQEFYIHDWNEFERYSKSNDTIKKYRCYGLVTGLNCPPINDGFHWCRSYIIYISRNVINIELEKKYNVFDNVYESKIKKYNIKQLKIENIDKKSLNNILDSMDKVYNDFPQIKGKIKEINEIIHPKGGINIQPQSDGTYIMEINQKVFCKESIAKKLYKEDVKSNYHPKNSSYKDMGIHEAGHMVLNEILKKKYNDMNVIAIDWNNNITSQEIINKAFNNLKINDMITKRRLIRNISIHSIKYNASETIAEAFVDYYVNKDKSTKLSKSIINIMKGMI